ncbi:MAG: FAD-binding protein [Clostridiales Family XIII bacterium]|nr:FAD-binding protein [Clostridiales Family XIII bacterium]
MSDFEVRKRSADVLVVGGGLGGLAAAIRARENGASVVVLEKANAERSGLAGSGIDHIQSYIPEVHEKINYSVENMANEQVEYGGNIGGLQRKDLIDYYIRNSAEDIIELEKYGLKFRFEDSRLPGGFRVVPQFHFVPTSYNFEGRDIKRALVNRALDLGVEIINRAHVRSLLKNGNAVTGAVAIGTREKSITAVNAKTTILATSGWASRLHSGVTSGDTFEFYAAPTASVGSGKVLAAKVGAEVVNLEFDNLIQTYSWINYSFTVGLPGGSFWPAGRIVDEDGNIVVERTRDLRLDEPDYRRKYRELCEHYGKQRAQIAKLLGQGKTLYFDLHEATDDELDYIWWTLGHEGKTGIFKHHLEKNGVNLKTARFPLRLSAKRSSVTAGLWAKDETTETNIENLYASGNEAAGVTPLPVAGSAVVLGFGSGKFAARRAKELAPVPDVSESYINALKRQAEEILSRDDGEPWIVGERALQALLDTRLGKAYTENDISLTAQLLKRLRNDLRLAAKNPHELSRAFEVLDLYDLAELVVASIRERKSSLGFFRRLDEADYPAEKYGDAIGAYWDGDRVKTVRLPNPAIRN